MGIEGMDGLLLLFTATASRKSLGARFANFRPLEKEGVAILLDTAKVVCDSRCSLSLSQVFDSRCSPLLLFAIWQSILCECV